jgi:hypothetical protein
MMAQYVVYVSDRRRDRRVRRYPTRTRAELLARRLNAELIRRYGRPWPGKPIPLAFVEREGA